MTLEQLDGLRKSMAATWSPAVWIGREFVNELIEIVERELKYRQVKQQSPNATDLEALKALLENASIGPLVVLPTDQLHIAHIAGPHNTVTNDMLAWDADAYVALRNAAPDIIAAAEREAALRAAIKDIQDYADGSKNRWLARRCSQALAEGK